MPCLTAILHVSFTKIVPFFLPGLANDHFHATDVQHGPAISSYALLAPPASSPSPDANGGIDLQVFDASEFSTLRLLRADRIQKGESKAF